MVNKIAISGLTLAIICIIWLITISIIVNHNNKPNSRKALGIPDTFKKGDLLMATEQNTLVVLPIGQEGSSLVIKENKPYWKAPENIVYATKVEHDLLVKGLKVEEGRIDKVLTDSAVNHETVLGHIDTTQNRLYNVTSRVNSLTGSN